MSQFSFTNLSSHSLDILTKYSNMLKILDRYKIHLQENRGKKLQHGKDQQNCILESEIKDIQGKIQDVQKIIKELEDKFFTFDEDTKKKTPSVLSAVNAIKRKAEETKQHMTRLKKQFH